LPTLISSPLPLISHINCIRSNAYRMVYVPLATAATELDSDVILLRSVYPPHLFDPAPPSSDESNNYTAERVKPFVTLTYAQSLDGKIAGKWGKQIRLSGEDSMRLTHRFVLFLLFSRSSLLIYLSYAVSGSCTTRFSLALELFSTTTLN
jgi:hypothetical protein